MPICEGARLKIKRADKHIAELESCIDRLEKGLTVGVHVDPSSGGECIKCDFAGIAGRDTRYDLAAIIGDAVHNLKCALDHVWLETTTRLIPTKRRIPRDKWRNAKFPVYPTANHLESALTDLQINVSAPKFFSFLIRQIKPYRGGDYTVWAVHKMDIRDKHRLLIPVIHYSSIGGIYIEDEYREIHRGDTWSTPMLPFFVNFERGLHVKDPGSASLLVMFEQGDSREQTRAPDTLRFHSAHVLMIVKLFEEFIES